MPTEKYEIRYIVDSDDAVARVAKMELAVRSFDKVVEQSRANLATLFKDLSGVMAWTSAVEKAGKVVGDFAPKATRAAKAAETVGANVAGLAALEAGFVKLGATLSHVAEEASRLKAGLASMPTAPQAGAGQGQGQGQGMNLPGLAAKAVAVSVARKLMQTSAGAFSRAEKTGLENVAKAEDFRATVQPLVELTGRKEADNSLMEEQLSLAEQTGMAPEQAAKFSEVFMGAIGNATEKWKATGGKAGISKDTAAALLPEAAKFARRTAIDPEVAGKLFGSLATFKPIPDVKTAMETVGAMEGHLNLGGLGTIPALSKPLQGLMGTLLGQDGQGGRFGSPEELAATFAAQTFFTKRPDSAATEIIQADAGLKTLAKEGRFGLKPEMPYREQLKRVKAGLAGKTDAEADAILEGYGLGNDTERRGIIKGGKLLEDVDRRLGSKEAQDLAKGALSANTDFMRSQAGRTGTASAKLEASRIRQGMAGEGYAAALNEAIAKRTDLGVRDTSLSNFVEGAMDWVSPSSWALGRTNTGMYDDVFVQKGLRERRRAAGLPESITPENARMMDSPDFGVRARGYQAEDALLRAFEAKLDKAVKPLADAADAMKQAMNQGRAPGNAAVVPMRP